MADNTAEVRFGGDASGAKQAAQDAAKAVKDSVGEMKSGLESLSNSVKSMQEQFTGAFSGMQAAMAKFNNVMFAVQNAMQGGSMFKEFVQSSVETAKESVALGKAFGITATEASYLKVATAGVGVSQETLLSAATKITRTLVQNEGAFTSLGVATRDTNGHMLNTRAIMEATNARLREFQEGTDRNIEGMKIYGRGWSEIAPLVSKFKGETEESRREAEALNLVMGQESVAALANYRVAQQGAAEVMEGIKNTIGQALMPQLTDLANWFRSVGPQAVEVVRTAMDGYLTIQNEVKKSALALWNGAVDAFSGILSAIMNAIGDGSEGLTAMEFFKNVLKVAEVAFISFRIGVEESVNFISGSLQQLANTARLAGAAVAAALHGDWQGVKDAWADYKAQTTKTLQTTMDDAVRIAEKGAADINKAIMGTIGAAKPVTAIKRKEDGERSEGGGTGTDPDKRLKEWKSELEQKKEAEGQFFKESLQEDILYWQVKLALVRGNGDKEKELRRNIQHEIYMLEKQSAMQGRQLSDEEISRIKKYGEDRIASEKETLRTKRELGVITSAEKLEAERALADQEYEISLQALRSKNQLYEQDVVQRQKILNEIEALERDHAKNVKKINDDILIDQKKQIDKWLDPITSAIDKSVNGMIQGTLTLQKAISGIFQSIIAEFISMGAKKVASWIATEIIMTKATKEGVAARGAAEEEGSAAGLGTQMTTALKTIMNYAAEAFAGVWASLAGIPIVGPAMAAVEAPAAMAGVMGAASMLSARNGFDIPAGVNPLVQTHEKEMILPREQADVIRSMAAGSGGGGDVHLHVHTQSTQDFKSFLSRNSHTMAPALRTLARNFTPSKA